jgi:molybdopterin-guanine dinucleotide biosynthesis protein A
MGQDKACLPFSGKTLFSVNLELLQTYFDKVIIAGNRPDLVQPDVPSIPDIYPGSALGGLFTGLSSSQTDWIFVAPCDMPYPDYRILEMLLQYPDGYDAVVPRTPKGYEPVFALYHKNCLPHMESMLRNNEFRIYDFYLRINVRYLNWHELPEGWERSLLNVNTPEDLARVKEETK